MDPMVTVEEALGQLVIDRPTPPCQGAWTLHLVEADHIRLSYRCIVKEIQPCPEWDRRYCCGQGMEGEEVYIPFGSVFRDEVTSELYWGGTLNPHPMD